jgi:hypothetical protein
VCAKLVHCMKSKEPVPSVKFICVQYHSDACFLLGTELSLSLRGRMTLEVGEIFWFISYTLPQCHAHQGVGDTYL